MKYFIQSILIIFLLLIFRLIGLKNSRIFSCNIFKIIGPKFRSKKISLNNISKALPNLSLKEQNDLVNDHLSDGAKKVRPLAKDFIEKIRIKIGIS